MTSANFYLSRLTLCIAYSLCLSFMSDSFFCLLLSPWDSTSHLLLFPCPPHPGWLTKTRSAAPESPLWNCHIYSLGPPWPAPWKKSYDKPRQCIKKQRHQFANKGLYSQSYGFSSSHVWMWELDHKEGWALKNWCFCTVVLKKTLESPLDNRKIKPVNPKGNQPWIFIGRTDAEAEAPILWPLEAKSWLNRKDPDARKYWWQEKGTTEDEMVDDIINSVDMSWGNSGR